MKSKYDRFLVNKMYEINLKLKNNSATKFSYTMKLYNLNYGIIQLKFWIGIYKLTSINQEIFKDN